MKGAAGGTPSYDVETSIFSHAVPYRILLPPPHPSIAEELLLKVITLEKLKRNIEKLSVLEC